MASGYKELKAKFDALSAENTQLKIALNTVEMKLASAQQKILTMIEIAKEYDAHYKRRTWWQVITRN